MINVHLSFFDVLGFLVYVNAVHVGGHHINRLLFVGAEEGRLLEKSVVIFKLVDACYHIIDKVQRENLIYFRKQNLGSLIGRLVILEMEVHACFLELRLVLEDDTIHFDELGWECTLLVFEDEQLIDLLLISNETLTTDDSNVFLVLAFLKGKDLVWLACFSVFQQLNVQVTQLFEGCGIVHVDFVDVCTQEHFMPLKLNCL
jgi:hypothetical protein